MAIYHQMKNTFFNKKMVASRSKFGLRMVARQDVKAYFAKQKEPTANIFGADQSPSISKKVYWTRFLNQDTAVMFGPEKFAMENNYPVIFGAVSKVKRGYYKFDLKLLYENPIECDYGEITEAHTYLLEQQIIEDPQYWLWTHKRWKRKRKPEEANDAKTVEDQLSTLPKLP